MAFNNTDGNTAAVPNYTIASVGHGDHGVSQEIMLKAVQEIAPGEGFFIANVALPEGVTLLSALYGPTAGDPPVTELEVHYAKRTPDRPFSRLVSRPHRPCSRMTILGMNRGGAVHVITAYGGPSVSPPEVGDMGFTSAEEYQRAFAFWRDHALAE